ncbi:YihY/virulence factor BrkB family protein [Limnoglobus roseus]|uniref:YihY/virulence factor BrkB family protein n=1 Tax=Limnoglobus roseus TaxID=2598579 RepID=A0A5C1APK7_9BACT|nr:YihY/virulence factor BrkB family protein [Limnoglobus roseus]QEL20087.1 YihY/virulence factor BrkB family protein [Limnoglobus roseus]
MTVRDLWQIVKTAGTAWLDHKAPRLAAAVAYYTILSLAPVLIIAVAVAGAVFGEEAARGQLVDQFRGMVGQSGAEAIQVMLEHASKPGAGVWATVIGIGTLVIGASGVFGELQDALNTVWDVKPRPGRGIMGVLHDRFLSFAMVLCIGFLLLVSLVLSTALSAMDHVLEGWIPGLPTLMRVANIGLGFIVVTVLFAMMFKFLPDVKLRWREVWLGAAVTAALFTLGKYLIGLYLGKAGVASPFGAAGSLVALVVWIYYSALILFFGAELTQVMTKRVGRGQPMPNAERLTEKTTAAMAPGE